ncbi:MAG: GTPase HflX [Candidatus Melainabacteria bacterium]|nr:GTPase HflX [Candidatus Melainabacteria bacterium]
MQAYDLNTLDNALLIGAYRSTSEKEQCEDYLNELERLCDSFGLKAVAKYPCSIKKIDSANYLGSGKLEELSAASKELKAEVIIFDDELIPHQQRNLEKIFNMPVIDRTELIIEVFAQRAQTREARLQIELAKVRYQFPRLKRLWTHLSRQSSAGGGAHLKGEGEKQIEIDRRLLRRQIERLKDDIEKVSEQRVTQRSLRERTGIPTFAIVGYTNAGKSTLLKALTGADVLVEDRLFAPLDTTTRKFVLPNKQEILLIDTVGFIRKIPHTLVAAFRSTLEEAVHTDILLHLVDVSHPKAVSQAEETMKVLKELGAESQPIITVLNKIDQCSDPLAIAKFRLKYPKTVAISATEGTGFDDLLQLMMLEISLLRKVVSLRVPQSQYGLVSELMREGRVISCEYEENDIMIKVEIPARLEHRVQSFIV